MFSRDYARAQDRSAVLTFAFGTTYIRGINHEERAFRPGRKGGFPGVDSCLLRSFVIPPTGQKQAKSNFGADRL